MILRRLTTPFLDRHFWGGFGSFAARGVVFSGAVSDVTAPTLSSATIPTGGGYVDLVYNESLDNTSAPATGDFSISVPSGSPPTISGISFQTTSVSNDTVRVSVSTNFYEPEADSYGTGVKISYTAGVNPIRDVAENNASNLTNQAVTNNSTQWPLTANGAAYSPEGGTLSGFLTDQSGNGNDLVTDSGDPAMDAVTFGDVCVDFTAASSHRLQLPSAYTAAMTGSEDQAGTLIAGVRYENTGDYWYGCGVSAVDYALNMRTRAGSKYACYRSDGTTTKLPETAANFAVNTWNTIGVFIPGTTVDFTRDGSTADDGGGGDIDVTGTSAATTEGRLGSRANGTGDFTGQFGRLVIDATDISTNSRDHAVLQTWVHDYTSGL